MKQYRYKEYDRERDDKQGHSYKKGKKTETYYKNIIYPWKNHQKSIRST